MLAAEPATSPSVPTKLQLDVGFHLMYELRFEEARAQIGAYEKAHPDDPVGAAAEAAAYLFEEFNFQGVLTSEFFLDDAKLLGGVSGPPDKKLVSAFVGANNRARALAQARLRTKPGDLDALLAVTWVDGMQADYESLINKRQLASLSLSRRAENEAKELLKVAPDMGDAYVAIGIANYITGSLPSIKRFVLWFGGIHGDRQRGMEQLQMAVQQGHYLQTLAKVMLALASEREHQPDRALSLFSDLSRDYPQNANFARELALLQKH
jgi:hypothetical protein